MPARPRFPLMFLLALFVALPCLARAQGAAPRDPYLAVLEKRELIVAAKRHNVLFERHPRPKPSGCATGRICSPLSLGIQRHRIDGTTLVAVLYDIDEQEDGLLVRLRFYNDGSEPVTLGVDPTRAYGAYFVEMSGERGFILRDEDGALEAKKPLMRALAPGAMESWWARFPPRKKGADAIDIRIPPAPRFEAISVSDF